MNNYAFQWYVPKFNHKEFKKTDKSLEINTRPVGNAKNYENIF